MLAKPLSLYSHIELHGKDSYFLCANMCGCVFVHVNVCGLSKPTTVSTLMLLSKLGQSRGYP